MNVFANMLEVGDRYQRWKSLDALYVTLALHSSLFHLSIFVQNSTDRSRLQWDNETAISKNVSFQKLSKCHRPLRDYAWATAWRSCSVGKSLDSQSWKRSIGAAINAARFSR